MWPTPKAMDASNAMPHKAVVKNGRLETISKNGKTGTSSLNAWVQMWPTPDVRGFTNKGSLEMLSKKAESQEEFSKMAYRASAKKKVQFWPTPKAQNANSPGIHGQGGMDLQTAVKLWPTPNARDWKDSGPTQGNRHSPNLGTIAQALSNAGNARPVERERQCGGDKQIARRGKDNGGRAKIDEIREWWAVEPSVCSVVDGLPAGMDGYAGRICTKSFQRASQLKCLGNAIVPQIAMMIWQGIKECERYENRI
jgi:hypothetical protein